MKTTKITITLSSDVMAQVDTLTATHHQSQFVADTLRRYIEQERKFLSDRLVAGYQSNATVSAAVATEWEAIDLENWPPYICTSGSPS